MPFKLKRKISSSDDDDDDKNSITSSTSTASTITTEKSTKSKEIKKKKTRNNIKKEQEEQSKNELNDIKSKINKLEMIQLNIINKISKNHTEILNNFDELGYMVDNINYMVESFSYETEQELDEIEADDDEADDDEFDINEEDTESTNSNSNSNSCNREECNNDRDMHERGAQTFLKILGLKTDHLDYIRNKLREMDLCDGDYKDNLEISKEYLNIVGNKNIKPIDLDFFLSIPFHKKMKFLAMERDLKAFNYQEVPPRFRVLSSNIPINVKDIILKKMNILNTCDPGSGEYHKLTQWVEGLLQIPFDTTAAIPVSKSSTTNEITSFLGNARQQLDKVVFGQDTTKDHIIQIIAKMITNPKSVGNVFAIHGPMGVGKTTIIKEGMAKALGIPFCFISLGGASDASYLDGHGYTYEGSTCGLILDCIKACKCMNPIFYFDELDKVSTTSRGQEIINLLIHLTDTSQNSHFQDKYYSGIHFDLSKAIFVFSFNIIENVNPILRDRMRMIKVSGFNTKEKIEISKLFLLPSILEEYSMLRMLEFNQDAISYIVNKIEGDEQGVRNLKRRFEQIISKLNVIRLYTSIEQYQSAELPQPQPENTYYNPLKNAKIHDITFPLCIDINIVNKLLILEKNSDTPPEFMYS